MFKAIKTYTKGIREKNEDYCYMGDSFGFVIDGASGLDSVNNIDDKSDAFWFSHFIGGELEKTLNDHDILTALTMATDRARGYYYKMLGDRKILPHQIPSASIGAFRIVGDTLEYLQLGDCAGVILFKDNRCKVLLEDKFVPLDKAVIDYSVKISRENGISIKAAMETKEIRNSLISNRQKKNKPDGYWILDVSGEGVPYSKVHSFKLSEISAIMCCSDGFAQVVGGFKIYDSYEKLIIALKETPPEQIANTLYKAQDEDTSFIRSPRFKHRDDTTVIYGEIE